jgi:hypothetical protein
VVDEEQEGKERFRTIEVVPEVVVEVVDDDISLIIISKGRNKSNK